MSRFQSASSHRLGACAPPRPAPWHASAPPAPLRPPHPVSAAAVALDAAAVPDAPSAEPVVAAPPPPSPPPDRTPSPLLQLESIHPCEERIVQRDDPPQQPARRAYPAARKLVKQTTVKW